MADAIGSGFDLIGTRQNATGQTEYYNTQNNLGFETPTQLSSFVNSYYGQTTTPDSVFNVLSSGRTQALSDVKDQLNSYQQSLYDQQTQPAKRASSSLADSIATEQGNYDSYFQNYQDLVKKLKELSAPNYQQSYDTLRTQAGVPGLENDFANNQKNIRELPYVNRQNFGNAGVTTEGQLAADTEQKGIPLEIQQGNLLDRLKLASDFVTNSLNLKEKDYSTAQDALSKGIDLVNNTIGLSRTHLNDLLTQQQQQQAAQQAAQQFAYDNRITKPFYEIAGTVFRTSDRQPAHNPQEYISMGGVGDFSDVQKVTAPKFTKDSILGDSTSGYFAIDPITGEKTQLTEGSNKYQAVVNPITGESQVFDPKSGTFVNSGSSTGGTLAAFINKYAPPSENDTGQYIQQIASRLGIDPNTPLIQIDTNSLAQQMALKESGTKIVNGKIVIPANTLAGKNNNPGNLRFVGQKGATQGAGGFARFSSPAAGYQALKAQIDLDKSRSGNVIATLAKQVQADPGIYKNLPDAQKKAVTNYMAQNGMTIPNVDETKPTPTELVKIRENASSGLRALAKVEEEINKGGNAVIFRSKLPFAPGARTYKAAVNEMKDVLTRLRTGAALNVDEQKFYEGQLPGAFDSDSTIQYKLSIFRNLFTKLQTQGRDTSASTDNDPLGLFK